MKFFIDKFDQELLPNSDFKNYLQEKLKNFQDLQTRSNLEAEEIERRCIQVDRQSDLKEHLNFKKENL